MRIIKEETVGLLIDIQERLFPHMHAHESLLNNVKILLEGLKILDVPTIITEQYRKGLGKTLIPLQDVFPDVNPIEKMSFSCCDELNFESELEQHGKKNIILVGIETHVCVLQTVVDLLEKGYQPVVIENCVGSRNFNDKNIAIERMRSEGAIISTYESILFELARISGTDSFKKISKLVK